MIERGGSSQDKFESDFIDDDEASQSDAEFDPKKAKASKDDLGDNLLSDEEAEYMSEDSIQEKKKNGAKRVLKKNITLKKGNGNVIEHSDDEKLVDS